jgi:hypothetical protein
VSDRAIGKGVGVAGKRVDAQTRDRAIKIPGLRPSARANSRHIAGHDDDCRRGARSSGRCRRRDRAEVLGIGRTVAYELVRTDRFPTPVLRVGRQIKIPTAYLIELLGLSTEPAATLPRQSPAS